ncbi:MULTISPECIES: ABC transporter permease [unclassified Paenibacillus]|uniref:YhgE/Pip domain-containing protein n=1 Tax=Paenibacillus provencensis TaxID=441151 RepID=A0ABW3PSI3_9BACL|nr:MULTISPECIES: ABC transporter permease [unclassified Paenibacillus]MCM3127105.1 ABC transporter permease [Paenibacillus sp. MER 78]SFS55942.1 YhgE/Pip N-terminal domain-containing protein [Paenibacillus sp. 453mf]
MKFKTFLKTRGAIAAIFMGIFYAVAMLGIFLPGYTAIPNNIDKLPVAIVNEDKGEYGGTIAEQLQENLPFEEISTDLSNSEALAQLEDNDLALVVHIPETFSQDLQSGDVSSSIDFTTNGAGATVVSSSMSSIVSEINNQLSTQFSTQTAQNILMTLNVPEDQAAEMAEKIETTYVGNSVTINEIPAGMHNNMLPMFLTMAGYVGAMIGAMQLVGSYKANRGTTSKWRLFLYVQITALLIATLSSAAGIGISYAVTNHGSEMFFTLWGHQILNYMVCFNFTAILIFLVGEGGMILNMPILLLQTIANGATIPRDMMYLPYEWMSYISPMYYAVQANFELLFTDNSSAYHHWMMAAVGGGALLINLLIVAFLHKPQAAEESIQDSLIEDTTQPNVKKTAEITV